jgi:hypothetical protein
VLLVLLPQAPSRARQKVLQLLGQQPAAPDGQQARPQHLPQLLLGLLPQVRLAGPALPLEAPAPELLAAVLQRQQPQ